MNKIALALALVAAPLSAYPMASSHVTVVEPHFSEPVIEPHVSVPVERVAPAEHVVPEEHLGGRSVYRQHSYPEGETYGYHHYGFRHYYRPWIFPSYGWYYRPRPCPYGQILVNNNIPPYHYICVWPRDYYGW